MGSFVATGSTITWESGFFAEILSISGPNLSREAIDMSHMGSAGGKEYLASDLYDGGELTVEIAYIPSTDIPINSAPSAVSINWSDSATTSVTFEAFMTGFEPTGELDGRATASVTLKVNGDVSNVAS